MGVLVVDHVCVIQQLCQTSPYSVAGPVTVVSWDNYVRGCRGYYPIATGATAVRAELVVFFQDILYRGKTTLVPVISRCYCKDPPFIGLIDKLVPSSNLFTWVRARLSVTCRCLDRNDRLGLVLVQEFPLFYSPPLRVITGTSCRLGSYRASRYCPLAPLL